MVQALSAFMDFCYLFRHNLFDKLTLNVIDVAMTKFHVYCIIFEDVGIHNHFSLPCQHSVKHFRLLIQMIGAPNGLCSSITELKHIKAVKEPYRHSSHFEALGQMLLTNQRIDKLAACCIDLTTYNMLDGPGCAWLLVLIPLFLCRCWLLLLILSSLCHHWCLVSIPSSLWWNWLSMLILSFLCHRFHHLEGMTLVMMQLIGQSGKKICGK